MENDKVNPNNKELKDILDDLDSIVDEIEKHIEQETINSIFNDVYASFEGVKYPYEQKKTLEVMEETPKEENKEVVTDPLPASFTEPETQETINEPENVKVSVALFNMPNGHLGILVREVAENFNRFSKFVFNKSEDSVKYISELYTLNKSVLKNESYKDTTYYELLSVYGISLSNVIDINIDEVDPQLILEKKIALIAQKQLEEQANSSEEPVKTAEVKEESQTVLPASETPSEMIVETVEDTPTPDTVNEEDYTESQQKQELETEEVVEEAPVEEPKTISKTDWKTILIIGLTLMLVLVGVYFFTRPKKEVTPTVTDTGEVIEEEVIKIDPKLKKMWTANKEINEDYVGEIIFDSGLIQESVVQAKNVFKPDGTPYVIYDEYGNLVTDTSYLSGNDVYIWTNWKTGEPVDRNTGIGGSTFLDFRNELSEKMLIVYGHHWARDYMEQHGIEGEPNFTALDKFEDKENYEINRGFSFILDNEIREYTVCAVYTIDVGDEKDIEPLAMGMFSEESLEHVKQLMLYDTDVEMCVDDDYMMLVTCKQHDPMHREIVLAKETGREVLE